MTDTTTQIPAQAIGDMRDVLNRDFGIIAAPAAPEANILRKIAAKFGSVQNFLDFYGPYWPIRPRLWPGAPPLHLGASMSYILSPLSATTTNLRRRMLMGERLGVRRDNQTILDQAYAAALALEASVYRAKDRKVTAGVRIGDQAPTPDAVRHGAGCSCCGAGVRQWR